jgi:hypothetical protein
MSERKTKQAVRQEAMRAWLHEHLPYELKMMRHSLRRMQQRGLFYLDWNSFHSAFAVAAANLAAFLTNTEKANNNFMAHDFVNNFRSRKGDLKGHFQTMEPQNFHLGTARTSNAGKLLSKDAKDIAEWVEIEIEKFIGALPDKKLWNHAWSIPEEAPDISNPTLMLTETNQTACTVDPRIVMVSFSGKPG